jgi:hypothetical protein
MPEDLLYNVVVEKANGHNMKLCKRLCLSNGIEQF